MLGLRWRSMGGIEGREFLPRITSPSAAHMSPLWVLRLLRILTALAVGDIVTIATPGGTSSANADARQHLPEQSDDVVIVHRSSSLVAAVRGTSSCRSDVGGRALVVVGVV